MKNLYIIILSVSVMAAVIGSVYFVQREEQVPDTAVVLSEKSALPQVVITALSKALDDEYKAYSTYTQILATYGNTRPFSNITQAETKHITALQAIYTNYALEIPKNPYENQNLLKDVDTVTEACAAGVTAEIANVALYKDTLLPVVSDYPDITKTFTQLMNASQNNHLPAFERCAQ